MATVPGFANTGGVASSGLSDGPTEAGASGMEIKELDVNIRPVGEARSGRIFAENTIISIPNIALKLAVGAEDQELVES